ncbi:hypothetical protein Clacol_007085 [Clathrus columnatus]|uniref:CCL2-like lectin domain-containing protein n=1 Tax=Clathrus columnatus TaxID=1419009 RepID=A0AAV5AF12_9AGAM|nr:hypothetical protein Clacol_007085 [Clathrus columnatus]
MKVTSVLSAAIVALSLGVQNAVTQNVLPNGTYQFISRITDPFGNPLALTSGTSRSNVTLTPLVFGQSNQLAYTLPYDNIWAVKTSGSGNEITVAGTSGNLEAGTQGTLPQPLLTLPSANFVWITKSVGGGTTVTISDPSNSFNWAAPTSTSGASVAVQSASPTPSAAPLQLWVPIIASTSN